MVRDPDPVDAVFDEARRVLGFLDTLDDQRPIPFLSDFFEIVPVGIAANGVTGMGN